MSNKLEVTLEIITHSTENEKRILESICELFDLKETEFSQRKLSGHFENPILLFNAKFAKKKASDFVERLVERIPKYQMDELIDNIEEHCDGSALFLRISKQDIIKKSIILQEKNAIKVKISVPVYNKNELIKTYVDLILPKRKITTKTK